MSRRPKMIELPFVAAVPGRQRRDFWHNVQSTGDDMKDQQLGSQLAYLALQAIKAENFAPLLGWIVMDMITNRCPEHVVVGFFQTVADVCLGNYEIPPADVRLVVPTALRVVK